MRSARTAPPVTTRSVLLASGWKRASYGMPASPGAHGSAVAAALLTDRVHVDEVFMAFHWSGAGQANRLVGDAVDPVSWMPELKLAAVRVERAELPADGGRA